MGRTPHGTLTLAASLAAMSQSQLRELIAGRTLVSPRSVRDPLSLAAELLRPESVLAALQRLDRSELAVLLRFGDGEHEASDQDREALASLRLRGLTGLDAQLDQPTALPEVDEAFDELLAAGVDISAIARTDAGASEFGAFQLSAVPADETAPQVTTDRWFGAALATVSRAAALLRVLTRRPARLSRRGAVTVTAQRDLALATHDDPERTGPLLDVLQLAGLAQQLTTSTPLLGPAPTAAIWLTRPAPERWVELASALVAAMPAPLRLTLDTSPDPVDLRSAAGPHLLHRFPLLPETAHTEALAWVEIAELLGLAVGGRLTPPAILLLAGDPTQALATAVRDFPSAAPGVYLQPDLSLIVPGPLDPADEHALAAIADTEQIGAAVTMRLSPASLTRALHSGQRTDDIRALLERLSLTGIPQPLDYLLNDLARKQLAGELGDAHRHADHWAGRIETAALEAPAVAAPADETTEHDEIAERVHAAAQQHAEAGDLTRQLELAIRERSAVRVTAVGGREERTFTLLPVSLTAGRLRATDQAAGVERTLPLSAITAVEAA